MFKYIKNNKKWIYIIVLTMILFIGASRLINSCSHSAVDSLINEIETETIKKLSMNDENDAEEVLKGIAKKNGDWSTYPLSKEFLEKYNSKDGIFPQYNFEDVSGNLISKEMINNSKSFTIRLNNNIEVGGGYSYYVGNGLFKLWQNSTRTIDVVYCLNKRQEIEDIFITYEKQGSDENGNIIKEYNEEFKPNNIYIIAQILFYDKDANNKTLNLELMKIDKEPISEHLKSEVKYKGNDKDRVFIDFFPEIDYNFGELYFGIIKTREEAFQQRKIYATCQKFAEGKEPYYDEPEKTYLYEVNFQFDSQNKLDDISVKYIKEISFEEYLKQYE